MKVIRTFLSALLVIGGLGSATLLSFGVGGCGGADEGGILVDGGDSSTTTPTGTTGGTTGATTGDEIVPPAGTTGSGTGEATGGETTGEATTGGEGTTGGGTTGGGETSGGSTYTLGDAPIATLIDTTPPTVKSVTSLDDKKGFVVTFSEPIDYQKLSDKKSVILRNDAATVYGAIVLIFTFGAVDLTEMKATLAKGEDSPNPSSVILMSDQELKDYEIKDSEGKWQNVMWRVQVFGGGSDRAVKDVAGNAMAETYSKGFECGSGKGKIPCGEQTKLGE